MSKYLFVHIPKTGGTSVRETLFTIEKDNWKRTFSLLYHDPISLLRENNFIDDDCFVFTVVRNPFTRAFSLYQYHKIIVMNFSVDKSAVDSWTFEYFLECIKTNKNIFFTPTLKSTQSYFVRDNNNNIDVNKVYKLENLQELSNDLNVPILKLNKGNYTQSDYINAYNDKTISLVQEIYAEDFINFNYSTNFS